MTDRYEEEDEVEQYHCLVCGIGIVGGIDGFDHPGGFGWVDDLGRSGSLDAVAGYHSHRPRRTAVSMQPPSQPQPVKSLPLKDRLLLWVLRLRRRLKHGA